MMTTRRWEAEVGVMHANFPRFRPYAVPGVEAGFVGHVLGPQTETEYEVLIKALLSEFPEKEPAVYMSPHAERHHWIHDNRLCYQRKGYGHSWKPAEDTFAQVLSLAMKYIAEFDGD